MARRQFGAGSTGTGLANLFTRAADAEAVTASEIFGLRPTMQQLAERLA